MFKIIVLIFLAILCSYNANCYASVSSLSQIQTTTYANKQTQEPLKQVINPAKHTSFIGTIDNPTIDGGIINSTDNIPVFKSDINSSQVLKIEVNNPSEIMPNITTQPNNKNYHSLNNNWATSNDLRNILESAVKTQKLQYVLQQSNVLKLPASVALIPIVESSYDDKAVSKKGAVGTWQLMPRTAIEYGLSPTQRSDFISETKAALSLLTNLHQEFGNWELAFAAYNAGSLRVSKALKENPYAITIDDLDLPIETKKYVTSINHINDLLTTNSINQLIYLVKMR